MQISILTDSKLSELSDSIVGNLTNLSDNLSKVSSPARNISLRQFLSLFILRHIVSFNYSIYLTDIKTYLLQAFDNAVKYYNTTDIIPIVEYVEINRNLSKLYSIFKSRADSLSYYIDKEDILIFNNKTILSTDTEVKLLNECTEINQILNFTFTPRPILNNTPYSLLALLNLTFKYLPSYDYFKLYFNSTDHIIIYALVKNLIDKLITVKFYQNALTKKILKTFQYFLINRIFQILEDDELIDISLSTTDLLIEEAKYTIKLEKYISTLIAPSINKLIEIYAYRLLDNLTANNTINFIHALTMLRFDLYKHIKALVNNKMYLELIKFDNDDVISSINRKLNNTALIDFYYSIIKYVLDDSELIPRAVEKTYYNIKFKEFIDSNKIFALSKNQLFDIQISINEFEIERIIDELRNIDVYNNSAPEFYNQIIAYFININDIYTYITDLLTIFYMLKYLA